MKKIYLFLSIFLFSICLFQKAKSQNNHLAKQQHNPLIPGYFADPTVKKFGDTYYIYATTDGNGGGFGPAQVWTSKDFVNWTMQDMNWPTTHHYWAPDATKGPDGKYYLYYCQPVEIFGASSQTPIGPWTSLLPPGKPIVPNFLVPNVITLDGQTFKDDDGKYYMYWGTWGIYPNHGCGVGLLNDDMKSFSKLAQIPNTDAKDFFEAPFVFKRKGIYYLTYSSGYCEDGTYRVQYATASHPMGPFKYAANNPILATNADGTVHGPGHQSVLQQGDDFYLVYHRHNNPHNDGGYHRQVAADKIVFDENGNILKLQPSHSGVGYLANNANPFPNIALDKTVVASSFYDQDFMPAYALDDNNGTLWKAKNNIGTAWIKIDLGKVFNVKSVHTQFEYATWYYQYKIEYSIDGKLWKLYADKSKNTKHGSPMIDFGDVKARYLRTTILNTEYPGLNKAIWNIKVFENQHYNPLMNTKEKPWQSLKKFDAKGLLVDLNFDSVRIGTSVAHISNGGKLGGTFNANDANKPLVSMIDGKKALVFSGRERLSSSNLAPPSMLGNSSYTVSMWVLNPAIDKEETIVSWTSRGGDNLTNAAVGYGNSKTAGAIIHQGWADLGFKKLPESNKWHNIVVVFDGTMERIYVDGKLDRAERRMLFINKLSHFLIGANEDGSAGFSGALAALKVYDIPLGEEEIKTSFIKGVTTSTLIYAQAQANEYGKLEVWKNNGTTLGYFEPQGKADVADVDGKIAVVLAAGSKLMIGTQASKTLNFLKPFTAVFSIAPTKGSRTDLFFGGLGKVVHIDGTGNWQQVICTNRQGKLVVYVNGKQTEGVVVENRSQKAAFLIESVGKSSTAATAISSLVMYKDALADKDCIKEYNFWKQTVASNTEKASFTINPLAISPNMVYMVASKPNLPGTDLEFLFKEESGKEGAKWLQSAEFIDFSATPQSNQYYTVKVKDNFGNVTQPSSAFAAKTDSSLFNIRMLQGAVQSTAVNIDVLKGTSWDGFLGSADTVLQQSNVLKMISHNTFWDGSSSALGPFAYCEVKGDFVAEVKLNDMLGFNQRRAYGANEAGIMVKAALNNHQLVQNSVMPGWGVGNIVTNLNAQGRNQSNNLSGWSFYKHLQIQRKGNIFFMRGSTDGKDWKNLPGSPIKRDDLANMVLQVGVYHATYGDIAGYASFSDFKIIQRK